MLHIHYFWVLVTKIWTDWVMFSTSNLSSLDNVSNFKSLLLGKFLLRQFFAAHCHKVKSGLFEAKKSDCGSQFPGKDALIFQSRDGFIWLHYDKDSQADSPFQHKWNYCGGDQRALAQSHHPLCPPPRVYWRRFTGIRPFSQSHRGHLGPSRGRDHFWIWKHPTHRGHKSFLRSQIEIGLLLRGIEGA